MRGNCNAAEGRSSSPKGNTPASWDIKDLKIMVSWFKYIRDSKMPTTKDKLITRYEQTRNCIESGRTYLKLGEEVVDVVDGKRSEVGDEVEDE